MDSTFLNGICLIDKKQQFSENTLFPHHPENKKKWQDIYII